MRSDSYCGHDSGRRRRSLSPGRYGRASANCGRPNGAQAPRPRMTDIFQEVDEEVRRDKAAEFWKKHQNLIIAGAALIVLAAAGFRYWHTRRKRPSRRPATSSRRRSPPSKRGKVDEANGGLAKLAAEAPRRLPDPRPDDRGRRARPRPTRRRDRRLRRDRRRRLGRSAVPRRGAAARGAPAARPAGRRTGGRRGADLARRRPRAPIAAPRA